MGLTVSDMQPWNRMNGTKHSILGDGQCQMQRYHRQRTNMVPAGKGRVWAHEPGAQPWKASSGIREEPEKETLTLPWSGGHSHGSWAVPIPRSWPSFQWQASTCPTQLTLPLRPLPVPLSTEEAWVYHFPKTIVGQKQDHLEFYLFPRTPISHPPSPRTVVVNSDVHFCSYVFLKCIFVLYTQILIYTDEVLLCISPCCHPPHSGLHLSSDPITTCWSRVQSP